MAYDIGPKIGIEGEVEFRRKITEINTGMRTLKTEMSAVASQFDASDKSQESYAAKSAVLVKQIDAQKQKLEELRKGLAAAAEKYGENDKVTQGWQQSVNKATADLNNMERELKQNETALDDVGDAVEESGARFEKLGGILKASAAAIGAVAAAAGAAAIKIGKEVVKQFGELEQNLGGSEAVFGEYAKSIQKTGEDAYKSMGVSQSQYLATANKMGALFQGSGVEQQKSLELTEQAMQRAADMASVMGIDMQQALDSVAGAAKGNFTMMDNLGVAMNATNIEAYALAKGLDFTWKTATQAEKAEVAMQMFFESTEQYAGNFEKEATTTVTGSIGLLQAALGSFTAGLGNSNADMKNLTGNLIDAFKAVVKNIVPIIQNLTSALPAAFDAILSAVGELLPELLNTATSLFKQILDTLLKLLPELIPVAVSAVMTILDTVIDNLPLIIDGALILIMALAQGLIDALPELIPAIVDTVLIIVDTLINNLDMIIKAAIDIILALTQGIINALPILIKNLPQVSSTIVDVLVENLPLLTEAGYQIIFELIKAIIDNLPMLIESGYEIIGSLYSGIIKYIGNMIKVAGDIFETLKKSFKEIKWGQLGINIINGITNGVKNAAINLSNSVKKAANDALGGVKNFLGINSPSTVMRDEVGKMMGLGMAEGITNSTKQVNTALQGLNTQIETGVNVDYKSSGSNVVVNVPLSMDGQVITKSTGRVQVKRNRTYSRSIGVMA